MNGLLSRMAPITAWCVAAVVWAITPLGAQPTFDMVITGGRIIDGSGDPWFYGDVAIKGDSIAAIGRFDISSATRAIDASVPSHRAL